MDLWRLNPGDKLRTGEGDTVEVVKGTEDGKWVLVRYLESPGDPSLVGTEDLCSEEELEEIVAGNTAGR